MDINENLINEIKHLNPLDTFDNFYNKSRDLSVLNNIINEVKKYDIYNFLARLSALNLVPENQNKTILFDALIAAIITIERKEYTSKNIMSGSKFRTLINQINDLDLKSGIDPSENAYIENVMFYGNYNIFTGITYLPAYCLQSMIKTLFLCDNNFSENFKKIAYKLILFILELSNSITTELGYKLKDLKKSEASEIIIPDSRKLEHLAGLVTINNDHIKLLLEDDKLIEEIYSDFGQGEVETSLKANQQKFDASPFIKAGNNKTIVLNISVLASFAIHKIICLSDKFGHKADLINAYNLYVWRDCRKSLDMLGHKRINEKEWGIDLQERNDYKEVLLNVCNNQIMIVTFISDDGKDYSEDSIFGRYPYDKFSVLLDKRLLYFQSKLTLQNLTREDVFHIIIINSFGRGIMANIKNEYFQKTLSLNPFDLRCIAVNEKSDEVFLPRYIRAKGKLRNTPYLFSELNSIEIYVKNRYSFYINDDFNPKKGMLYIAPGDSIDYIIRAINKENRHLVESFEDNYLKEVVLNDKLRNIYTDIGCDVPRASLMAEFKNVIIWIFSPEITEVEGLNLYFSIVDAISYWLEECIEIIEYYNFTSSVIKLQIILAGNLHEYYYESDDDFIWNDKVSFEVNENNITLIFTPEAFRLLSCIDNRKEKEMIKSIIEQIGIHTVEGKINTIQLDNIFANPLKKKFFNLDYMNHPYLKPFPDGNFRRIKLEDENELLDDIGSAVLASGKWSYGIVKDEDRNLIANYVVGYLYESLQKEIKDLRSDYFAELICFDLEKVMYNLMLSQSRYAYDIACYPEKHVEIFDDFNELNKTSIALKFLAEYIAACPPDGTQILGEWKYEKLLTICSLIIDWAYKNDLFYYKIFNTPVEILKSDRIGMKQDEFNKLQFLNFKAREDQLSYISSSNLREKLSHNEFPNIEEELNIAFFDEYGFSFNQFTNCIFDIISFGNQNDSEVKKVDKNELITWIVEHNKSLSKEKVEIIIQCISLASRDDYLNPDSPYRKEDVYPWRFNRELSFTRRPIIIRNNEMIWGNRQLYHMMKFIVDLIFEGKLKTRGKKLTKLIGKITNKRGEDFNNQVYTKVKEICDFIVDKNIKKINKKNIADETGNTLGDIDLLYIIPKKKRIVLAEIKDFNFSRSPYEMDCEYQRIFVDKGDKKCYATKHRRRALWAEENLDDIKIQYGLLGDGWTVKDIFIVNEAVISNAFYNVGATILTYGEISKEKLQSV